MDGVNRFFVGLLFSYFTGFIHVCRAHSFLDEPPSRNVVANQQGGETCPHCLQAGGPTRVIQRGNHIWPTALDPDSHGLCGDPVQGANDPENLASSPYLVPSAVQRTYRPGEVVEFRIGVSTHHQGHYEFRICDRVLDGKILTSAQEGQDCLNKHVLHRAEPDSSCDTVDPADCQPVDEKHPERWYLPPDNGEKSHTMKYKIPVDLTCTHCTLQWYWVSGNTCLYDKDYMGADGYFQRHSTAFAKMGWDPKAWCPWCLESWANMETKGCKTGGTFGEEFWNCADIAVLGKPGDAPAPNPPRTDDGPMISFALSAWRLDMLTAITIVSTVLSCLAYP